MAHATIPGTQRAMLNGATHTNNMQAVVSDLVLSCFAMFSGKMLSSRERFQKHDAWKPVNILSCKHTFFEIVSCTVMTFCEESMWHTRGHVTLVGDAAGHD